MVQVQVQGAAEDRGQRRMKIGNSEKRIHKSTVGLLYLSREELGWGKTANQGGQDMAIYGVWWRETMQKEEDKIRRNSRK